MVPITFEGESQPNWAWYYLPWFYTWKSRWNTPGKVYKGRQGRASALMVDLLFEKSPLYFHSAEKFPSRIKTGTDIDILMQSKWQAGLIPLEITRISFHIPLPASMALLLKSCFTDLCHLQSRCDSEWIWSMNDAEPFINTNNNIMR